MAEGRLGRDDEENLELLSISFVDAPVADFDTFRLDFLSGALDIRNQDGRTVLARVATIDCETDSSSIPFKDDSWHRIILSLDFRHTKRAGVPARRRIQVRYR